MLGNLEMILRLVLSSIVGAAIGVEREVSNRPAGLRTHILVTVGATLITLLSIYSFPSGDSSRVAAQIVSGIGFLGAGTILRTGDSITGLTTAASIWVCGGIGMAIGAGYYLGGLVTAGIVLLVLASLSSVERLYIRDAYADLEIRGVERPGLIGDIGSVFGKFLITIKDIKVYESESTGEYDDKDPNNYRVTFIVKLPVNIEVNRVTRELLNIKGISNVLYNGKKISGMDD